MQTDRDLSFDAFRGIAIIAVIAIHAGSTGFLERQALSDGKGIYFLVAYFQPLFFAIPAFIFMAGYWAAKRPVNSIGDYKTFLVRKLPRILIPYLFWSLVIFGWKAVKTRNPDVYCMILALLTGRACFTYYFILLIAQLYVVTPVLRYINCSVYGPISVLVLNAATLLALYLLRIYHGIGGLSTYWLFCVWIIFYEIGLIAGSQDSKFVLQKKRFFVLSALLVSLLLSVAEGIVWVSRYDNLSLAIAPIKYSSFIYSGCMILSFLAVRESIKRWPGILVAVGNYSYGIYLIHIFILARVVEIVKKIDILWSFPPASQFVIILATLSASFILISLTRKLLPETFCRRVFGF
jgi:peptidoglycan/LPS O-acetylase OafA/YrhL